MRDIGYRHRHCNERIAMTQRFEMAVFFSI
jgi:hypothetical protein